MGREWIDSHDLALLRKAFLVRQGGNLANMEEERMPTFMDNYSGFRVPADMVYVSLPIWYTRLMPYGQREAIHSPLRRTMPGLSSGKEWRIQSLCRDATTTSR